VVSPPFCTTEKTGKVLSKRILLESEGIFLIVPKRKVEIVFLKPRAVTLPGFEECRPLLWYRLIIYEMGYNSKYWTFSVGLAELKKL
jgi:hypothetical protein